MSNLERLKAEVLGLPPKQRENLAFAAWESLGREPSWLGDPNVDPEGIAVAIERDYEIDSGESAAIDHEEFLRRTNRSNE